MQRIDCEIGRSPAALVVCLVLVMALSACVDTSACEDDNPFATEVVAVSYGTGQHFGRQNMPEVVFGPPLGGGLTAGSTDVVSLGNGGRITLGFGERRIVDGPGVDFVVFENPFEANGELFAELASVQVSDDGVHWSDYPCAASTAPYDRCAGVTPVLLNGQSGPFDPAAAGGDGFDLAEVGLSQARYVRITDRPDIDGFAGVFDLDAVGIVHGDCR